MRKKLPVFRSVLESYRLIWANAGYLMRVGLPVFILASVAALALERMLPTSPGFDFSTVMLEGLPHSIARVLILSAFAVPWHRRLLGRPLAPSSWSHLLPLVGLYGAVASAIEIVIALLVFLPFKPLPEITDTSGLSVIALYGLATFCALAVLWLVTRLGMCLPAIALGQSPGLSAVWRATRGNGLRLIWGFILVAIVPFLLMMVAYGLHPIVFAESTAKLLGSFFIELAVVAMAVAGISFLTVAYRTLMQDGGATVAAANQ